MRLKNYLYRLTGAISAFALLACVDDSFNLDDVSTEVTLGSGTTTLPLGYLEDKTLEELLGGDIEGLLKDEEGNLSYNYSGEGDTIDIEGISTEFDIPQISKSFDVDFPKFDFEMNSVDINEESNIVIDIAGLDKYINEADTYYFPENVQLPTICGSFFKKFDGDDLHLEMDIPEQIKSVKKVIFRDIDNNHHGAPMHLTVDFADLASVNGGGELQFDLRLEGGTFRILDAENNEICNGNEYNDTYTIEAGAETLDFTIYVESLTNDTPLDENHHLDIPMVLTFDLGFEIDAKPGYFSLAHKPHIELNANFEYGDAEVEVDAGVNLVEYNTNEDGDPIEITGLPEQIKMVNRVAMVQNENSVLNFFAKGLEWLGEYAEDVVVEVTLPDYLKLRSTGDTSYSYDAERNTLRAAVDALEDGVELAIEALDFGSKGVAPDSEGNLSLSFTSSIVAHFEDDATISVSQIMHNEDVNVEIGLEPAHLSMESVSGKVDYTYEVDEQFALTGLEDIDLGGVEIGGIGLKPVIEVDITHPLTMSAQLSGSVTPSVGGVAIEKNRVEFGDVVLPQAKYINGAIDPAEVTIIIADESLREKYADAKYTFVSCDVTKLLLGTLPDTFDIQLAIGVDSEQTQTIYMDDKMSIKYDYRIDIPFTIDNSLEINYNDTITGLNSTFSTIADYDFKVGDVTVIAIVKNTTPLEFAAQVTLLDADGQETEAQVNIPEGDKILGSADGTTPKESTIRLQLDLGKGGHVSNIGFVDAINVKLNASSAAVEESVVPLNNNQYVGVKFQLELKGGITVDLDKLPL